MRGIQRYPLCQTSGDGLLSYGKLCSRIISTRWMAICSCLRSQTKMIIQEEWRWKKANMLILAEPHSSMRNILSEFKHHMDSSVRHPSLPLVTEDFHRNWEPLWWMGIQTGEERTEKPFKMDKNTNLRWWLDMPQRGDNRKRWIQVLYSYLDRAKSLIWTCIAGDGKLQRRVLDLKLSLDRRIECNRKQEKEWEACKILMRYNWRKWGAQGHLSKIQIGTRGHLQQTWRHVKSSFSNWTTTKEPKSLKMVWAWHSSPSHF